MGMSAGSDCISGCGVRIESLSLEILPVKRGRYD